MDNYSFFNQDVDFQLNNIDSIKLWLAKLIQNHNKIEGELTYIFCSDDYLLSLNKEHLNHDTYTDIITFDYTHVGILSGDIFISIDRIKENCIKFEVSFEEELHRVMAHGILHLIGFSDKSEEEKIEMRKQENKALALIQEVC